MSNQAASVYRSIVVGVDFTPCSAVALGQAIRMAAWAGVRAHPVHVIDTAVVIELESVRSPMQMNIRDGLIKDAEKAWEEFAARVPGAEGLALEVAINNRVVGILDRVRHNKADLIVIGAFGHRKADVGVGTVATACVRRSPVDVLMVRDTRADGGQSPFRRIMAAVDFSETSLRAVARAASVAARDQSELHVVHVFRAPWSQLQFRLSRTQFDPSLQRRYREALEMRLAEFCRPALEAEGVKATPQVMDYAGHRSGIVECAGQMGADLIVLGTRGHTNLRDVLLGSTAERALSESTCSILAVKPADAN